VRDSHERGVGLVPLFFADDELNLPDEGHSIAVLRGLLERGLAETVTWRAYFNPTPFSDELAQLVRETNGLVSITVDSAADKVLASSNKPFRRRHLDALVQRIAKHGVSADLGLIFGLPGETAETVEETIAFVRALPPEIKVAYSAGARVYPHTPLSRIAEREPERLVGADDPSFLAPVVYSSPWPPRELARRVGEAFADLPNVERVESVVDLDPSITREQYGQILTGPQEQLPAEVGEALERSTGEHITVLTAYAPSRVGTDEARDLVSTIREDHPEVEGEVMVSGQTAFDVDSIEAIKDEAPLAIAFVVGATYVVLFLLLGSVILPVKAVVMNFLSISASYGALVWIFQDGNLSGLLGFTPNPIDTSIPILMFCILFGLSMDYEVLLLSRIKEEYGRTGDNARAVALGLEKTGRLVTGAAAIMAAVFFSFVLAETTVIKAIGLGMGIAVTVDATIVRALLVPATMRLMGRWNWWVPKHLARLYDRLGLPESSTKKG
jgi:hypothetical protein